MKTTGSILLLLLSGFLLSSKCYKEDPLPPCILKLDNKTNKALYVLVSFDYPDTSLNFQNPRVNPNTNNIDAYSTGTIKPDRYLSCLDGYFDSSSTMFVEKISVYVFDAALVNSTPWSQVRQNYQVLKRFDLGKNDIINNNYTLTLP